MTRRRLWMLSVLAVSLLSATLANDSIACVMMKPCTSHRNRGGMVQLLDAAHYPCCSFRPQFGWWNGLTPARRIGLSQHEYTIVQNDHQLARFFDRVFGSVQSGMTLQQRSELSRRRDAKTLSELRRDERPTSPPGVLATTVPRDVASGTTIPSPGQRPLLATGESPFSSGFVPGGSL